MADMDKEKGQKVSEPRTTNGNGDKRGQGSEDTDGNGRGFTGQGSQKEGSSETSEGTGYTNKQ